MTLWKMGRCCWSNHRSRVESTQCWLWVFSMLWKWDWPLWCWADRDRSAEPLPSSTKRSVSLREIRKETSAKRVSPPTEKYTQSQSSKDRFALSKRLERDCFRPPSIPSQSLKVRGRLCYRPSRNRRGSPLRDRLSLPRTKTQGSVWRMICRSTPLCIWGGLSQSESWFLFPTVTCLRLKESERGWSGRWYYCF